METYILPNIEGAIIGERYPSTRGGEETFLYDEHYTQFYGGRCGYAIESGHLSIYEARAACRRSGFTRWHHCVVDKSERNDCLMVRYPPSAPEFNNYVASAEREKGKETQP